MVVSAVQSPFEFGQQNSRLARSRVLVSGAEGAVALGLVGLLAETGCRLIVDDAGSALALQDAAPAATLVEASTGSDEAAVLYAQSAIAIEGGIDIAINVIRPTVREAGQDASSFEAAATEALRNAFHVTRVIANRMRTTWRSGLIINVLVEPETHDARKGVLMQMTRATLAGWTRSEAQRWAEDDVTVLAIASVVETGDDAVYCDHGLAELILAAGNGTLKSVSGVTLDPQQAGHWC